MSSAAIRAPTTSGRAVWATAGSCARCLAWPSTRTPSSSSSPHTSTTRPVPTRCGLPALLAVVRAVVRAVVLAAILQYKLQYWQFIYHCYPQYQLILPLVLPARLAVVLLPRTGGTTTSAPPYAPHQVRLCHGGVWRMVTVDDVFPTNAIHCLAYLKAARRQLWVPLIEKAAAKLHGSYEVRST